MPLWDAAQLSQFHKEQTSLLHCEKNIFRQQKYSTSMVRAKFLESTHRPRTKLASKYDYTRLWIRSSTPSQWEASSLSQQIQRIRWTFRTMASNSSLYSDFPHFGFFYVLFASSLRPYFAAPGDLPSPSRAKFSHIACFCAWDNFLIAASCRSA